MEISIGSTVICTDGKFGKVTYAVLDPDKQNITHTVIRPDDWMEVEHMIPIEFIIESSTNNTRLRCTKAEATAFPAFKSVEFIPAMVAGEGMMYWPYGYYAEPYTGPLMLQHEVLPKGELAIRRGDPVDATDGHIGRVDEFLVERVSGHITHLIMREGHLWGQKDVTIPVSELGKIESHHVQLKLSKAQIEALPAISVRRYYL